MYIYTLYICIYIHICIQIYKFIYMHMQTLTHIRTMHIYIPASGLAAYYGVASVSTIN